MIKTELALEYQLLVLQLLKYLITSFFLSSESNHFFVRLVKKLQSLLTGSKFGLFLCSKSPLIDGPPQEL